MLKIKNKILSSLVIAVPLLLNTGVAATVHASPMNNNKTNIIYKSYYSFSNFQTKLDTLVASGTITQDQETILLNLYNKGEITTRTNFKTQLDVLVTIGTITQSQEISILNLFTSWGPNWQIPAPAVPNGPSHNNTILNGPGHNFSK